jgi:hypothetical protein
MTEYLSPGVANVHRHRWIEYDDFAVAVTTGFDGRARQFAVATGFVAGTLSSMTTIFH